MLSTRVFLVSIGLTLTAVACRAPAHESEPEPEPLSESLAEPEPTVELPSPAIDLDAHALAIAESPCGRYRLRLDHAEWSGASNERPKLKLQMTCVTGDADAFICGPANVTNLVSEAGVEWREKGLGGRSWVQGTWGTVIAHDLTQYERANSAQRVRVECRVLRVFEWRTYEVACDGPEDTMDLICAPYHVGVAGTADWCTVTAFCTDDRKEFPPAQRDLFGLLSHDWVAGGVEFTDADGQTLQNSGANSSGGFTTTMYTPPFDGREARAIRYPVTGTLRLPHRYVVELVPFEFQDVRLVRE